MLLPENFGRKKIKVNDIEINCEFGGNKANEIPLLLIHGYPQTHIMWHLIIEKLSQKQRKERYIFKNEHLNDYLTFFNKRDKKCLNLKNIISFSFLICTGLE